MPDQPRKGQAEQPAVHPNPALLPLDKLVGEWNMAITSPAYPSTVVSGHATFEWLAGGAFLLMRTDIEPVGPPSGLAVIGRDDAGETYSMLYYDSRGVSRLYAMTFADGVWQMHREAPGFLQRFVATINADGTSISGRWDKSSDGSNWQHDLDWSYQRVK